MDAEAIASEDAERFAKHLTPAQKLAMLADRSRGDDAFSMRTKINTMWALQARGLVDVKSGLGSMFSPHSAIKWPLTEKGKAVRAILLRDQRGGKQ